MKPRHVAIIAALFPPIKEVGARRPLRLANHLAAEGHDVTVYALHPRSPGLGNFCRFDASLLADVDRRVRVVRTPSFHGWKILLGWRAAIKRVYARSVKGKAAGTTEPRPEQPLGGQFREQGLRRLISRLMDLSAIPDPFNGWIATTLPVVLARSVRTRPDVIYATAPPWSPLLLAVLAARALRIPFHVDFRDPWTLNPYLKAAAASTRLERWVVGSASSIIANTESMADDFRRVYPEFADRVVTIYNGYDEATRLRLERLRAQMPGRRPDHFVVAHVGRLYPSRMPRPLARTLACIAREWSAPRAIRFRFVGSVWDPQPLVEEFGHAGVSTALELVGDVRSDEALRETVNADVLMLLQSGAAGQLPAKIFEYAFAGNPIVTIAEDDSEASRLFRRYGLGVAVNVNDAEARLREHLSGLCEATGARTEVPALFLDDFDGRRLAAQMAGIVCPGRCDLQSALDKHVLDQVSFPARQLGPHEGCEQREAPGGTG